jgi:hypothetical protein
MTQIEKDKIRQELAADSHMVLMIFKFYLQSNEYEFFIRRLRNVTGTAQLETNFGKQVTNYYAQTD